jgi:rhodanese-related sulfurtransferase
MVQNLTPQQAQELISRGEVEVVDVRDAAEWSGGHLPGARLVPLDALRANPKELLPHDAVLFVCAAGMRSQTAARLAAQNGLTKVYNLSSGTRGWANAGLPLETELRASA